MKTLLLQTGARRSHLLWLACAFVGWNAISLTRYPLVGPDEVWLNDPAYVLATRGQFGSLLMSADGIVPYRQAIQPFGQTIVTAAVYKAFGFGLWQTRILPLLAGGLMLAALGLAGAKLLGSSRAGFFAALFFALVPALNETASYGRMDTLSLCSLALALVALAGSLSTGSLLASAAAGFMCGVAVIFHLAAVSYGAAAVAALVLALPGSWRDRIRSCVAFGLAAAVAPLGWILSVLSADRHGLDTVIRHGRGKTPITNGLNLGMEAAAWFQRNYDVPIVFLIVVGTLWLATDPDLTRHTRRALTGLIVPVVLFKVFAMEKFSGYYALYPLMVLALAIGGATASVVKNVNGAPPLRLSLLAGWLCLLVLSSGAIFGARIGAITVQREARDYGAVVTLPLREVIPPGSVVWGDAKVWYALAETGSILRGPFIWINVAPDPAVDAFVVVQRDACPAPYKEIRRIGRPLPSVAGHTFSNTDYDFVICALSAQR